MWQLIVCNNNLLPDRNEYHLFPNEEAARKAYRQEIACYVCGKGHTGEDAQARIERCTKEDLYWINDVSYIAIAHMQIDHYKAQLLEIAKRIFQKRFGIVKTPIVSIEQLLTFARQIRDDSLAAKERGKAGAETSYRLADQFVDMWEIITCDK